MIHHLPLNGFKLHEHIQESEVCSSSPSIYIEMRNMPKSRLCECCGRVPLALPASPIQPLFLFFIFPDWLERCFTRTSLTQPLLPSLVIETHAAGVKGPHGKRVDMLTILDEGLSLCWQALPVLACSASEGDVENINKSFKMSFNDIDCDHYYVIFYMAVTVYMHGFCLSRKHIRSCRRSKPLIYWKETSLTV